MQLFKRLKVLIVIILAFIIAFGSLNTITVKAEEPGYKVLQSVLSKYGIIDWELDETNNYIYAIYSQYNYSTAKVNQGFLILHLEDLSIASDIPLNTEPVDLTLNNGRIYVSDINRIYIIDPLQKKIIKELDPKYFADQIVVDGNKLFYVDLFDYYGGQGPDTRLFEINIETNEESQVNGGFYSEDTSILLDSVNHILYQASLENGLKIRAMSTLDYSKIKDYTESTDLKESTFLMDGGELFFAGKKFNTQDLKNNQEVFYKQNIYSVNEKFAISKTAIYNRYTGLKLANLNSNHVPFLYDKKGNLYAYLVENNQQYLKKIKVVEDPIFNLKENGTRSFQDIDNHWARLDIKLLSDANLVKGTSPNTFAPNQSITRAEFATLIARVLQLQPKNTTNPFSDVGKGSWYENSVKAAYDHGIISGYNDGTFKPNKTITRQELVVMSINATEYVIGKQTSNKEILTQFRDSDKISTWAENSVAISTKLGLVHGSNGQFMPLNNATRAESVAILKRLIFKIEKKDQLLTSAKGFLMAEHAQLSFSNGNTLYVVLDQPEPSLKIHNVEVFNNLTNEKAIGDPFREFSGWDGKSYSFTLRGLPIIDGIPMRVKYQVTLPFGTKKYEKIITVAPTLQSVTGRNAWQLDVKAGNFQQINMSTMLDKNNYYIEDELGSYSIKSIKELSSDHVVLTLDRPILEQKEIGVIARNIKRLDGSSLPELNKKILIMKDETKPEVIRHFMTGRPYELTKVDDVYTSVTLRFNEPVTGTVKINDVIKGNINGESITIDNLNLDASKKISSDDWHKIEVFIKDATNNENTMFEKFS